MSGAVAARVRWSMLLLVLALCGALAFRLAGNDAEPPVAVNRTALEFFGPTWDLERRGSYRLDGMQLVSVDEPPFPRFLRVDYPAGSGSPRVDREGAPGGGAQLYLTARDRVPGEIHLRYHVRFPEGFSFGKGGMLPGLFVSDRSHLDRTERPWSMRGVWRAAGASGLYVTARGTGDDVALQNDDRPWRSGRWLCVQQMVRPAESQVRMWVDGELVVEGAAAALEVERTQVHGLFFSTFFGGADRSWATPRPQYLDFAAFEVGRKAVPCRT